MAKSTGSRKDQKKKQVGTSRTGKTNQYQAKSRGSIGSSKPGGDGPGTKKCKGIVADCRMQGMPKKPSVPEQPPPPKPEPEIRVPPKPDPEVKDLTREDVPEVDLPQEPPKEGS
jgi:hypothetical protein